MSANGISTLATKELRQKAKLELAQQDRLADGKTRPYYDITQLPTQYDDNTVVDNPNVGGLVVGRPWQSTPLVTFVQTNLILNLLSAPTLGGTWTDASGNGRNGTVRTVGTGSATYTSSNGGGLTLGSANNTDAAMISTGYILPVTNWSVEIVADTQPNGYWASLFGSEVFTTNLGHFMYWSGNTGVNIGKPTNYNTYNDILPTSGGPRHIVVTVTGGVLRAYLNGTLLTPTTTGYIAPSNTGSGTLNFGSRHPNGGTNNTPVDCMPGTYYQMRVYNKALSQAEVTQNYTASKSYTSGLP